jgi:predicted anti-sigma-YlaC factor YlaD
MLDGEALRGLSHHLDTCQECREAVEQLTRMTSLLRSVRNSPLKPADSFWADAYRTARLSPNASNGIGTGALRVFATPPRWRTATLIAICVAVVVLSFLPIGTMRGIVAPADAAPSIDVSALLNAHASSTSDEPLADHQRLSMIVSDITAQQAGGNAMDDGSEAADGALNAGPVSN